MGFRKTIIYGAKCDKCGRELAYRIENPSSGTNPTKTSTMSLFKQEGWKVTRVLYLCPECAVAALGEERGKNGKDL